MSESSRLVRQSLEPLVDRVWDHWNDVKDMGGIVRPAMPILFFGNLDVYADESSIRIVTVALNPSNNEFPSSDPFLRFPEASQFDDTVDHESYLRALSSYFEVAPYFERWFKPSFDSMLSGFDAGYREKEKRDNRALHLDLFSCIATNPTWSHLFKRHPDTYAHLVATGVDLWHDLLDVLEPDIVLLSFKYDNLRYVRSVSFDDVSPFDIGGHAAKGVIKHTQTTGKRKPVHWVWGSAARKPFLVWDAQAKKNISQRLRSHIFEEIV